MIKNIIIFTLIAAFLVACNRIGKLEKELASLEVIEQEEVAALEVPKLEHIGKEVLMSGNPMGAC